MPEDTEKAWAAEDIFAIWCSVGGSVGGEEGTEGPTEMGTRWVSTACVVVLAADALESGRLVYWHGRCAILIFVVRVLDGRAEGGEAVGAAGSVGRVWLGGGEVDDADDVGELWECHRRRSRGVWQGQW